MNLLNNIFLASAIRSAIARKPSVLNCIASVFFQVYIVTNLVVVSNATMFTNMNKKGSKLDKS